MSAVVRTVRGDVPAERLGPCDAHEHLFLTLPGQPASDALISREKAIEEAGTLAAAGARALVDWTPLGVGRSPAGLLAVAEATGLHVVAATGVHRDVHYAAADPLLAASVDELADRFACEIATGMQGTAVRAGLIKVAAGYHRLSVFEERGFAAAAEAHRRTGAPIGVHCEHGTMGLGIVQRLTALGVPAQAIVLAHVDRNPDAGEHAETAATGAWLQLDGPGRTKYWPDATIIALIAELAERGCSASLLLGGDTGRASMMRAYGGGPGMDYCFARFGARLRRELGDALADAIFVANPARAFALASLVNMQ